MLERKEQEEEEDGARQRSASHRTVGDVCAGRDPVAVGERVLRYLEVPRQREGQAKGAERETGLVSWRTSVPGAECLSGQCREVPFCVRGDRHGIRLEALRRHCHSQPRSDQQPFNIHGRDHTTPSGSGLSPHRTALVHGGTLTVHPAPILGALIHCKLVNAYPPPGCGGSSG